MKRMISLLLSLLMIIPFMTFHHNSAEALGPVWVKEYNMDKFGDKTDQYYLTNKSQFKGTFNSDSVSKGKLGVQLIFERDQGTLLAYITLFLKGKDQVKNGSSSIQSYDVSVKRANGSQFNTSGEMSAGEDRIKISNTIELSDAIKSGDIDLYIEDHNNANNNYLFEVKSGNFNDLFNQEILEPYMAEKYQEAELLLEENKYDEAAMVFEALGNYKDSAARLEEVIETKKAKAYETVGSVVTFGTYEQDNDETNGKEDIEWIVVSVKEKQSLLISKYVLDCQPYNSKNEDITWEKCTLRSWLNDIFLNTAFTPDEQKAILTTYVANNERHGNRNWDTNGGNDTKDKIFLLSYAEAWYDYLPYNLRKCEPTAYAYAQGAGIHNDPSARSYYKNVSSWWLRSPGTSQNSVAIPSLGGDIYHKSAADTNGIRPAIWINLESGIF